jgi:preprotein translocase subunit YajC
MFITDAYAQAASGAAEGGAGSMLQFLPLVLIFVVFYFLLIRPQQRKMKEHKALVSAVKRGDRVVTSGGLIGQVHKVVDDSEIQLEIAEGVRVRVLRGSINEVLNRTEPAKVVQDNSPDKKSGDGR